MLAISIVICTWNRADMLADTLRSIAACARDGTFALQVVVVDNASSDHTAQVIDALHRELEFENLHEPTPGLSIARNRGADAARGDWVVFLDDDVLLPADFLVNYARAIRALPDAGFIAGGVIAHFDEQPPAWVEPVRAHHWWCFSAISLDSATTELTESQFPYGANMAIRRDILAQFRFSDHLGFKHGVLIPGEETDLFARIRAAGHRGFWVHDVPLRHRLPPQRHRLGYLLARAIGQGRADAHRDLQRGGPRVALWVIRSLVTSAGAAGWRFVSGRPTWGSALVQMSRSYGHARGLLDERRPVRPTEALGAG